MGTDWVQLSVMFFLTRGDLASFVGGPSVGMSATCRQTPGIVTRESFWLT